MVKKLPQAECLGCGRILVISAIVPSLKIVVSSVLPSLSCLWKEGNFGPCYFLMDSDESPLYRFNYVILRKNDYVLWIQWTLLSWKISRHFHSFFFFFLLLCHWCHSLRGNRWRVLSVMIYFYEHLFFYIVPLMIWWAFSIIQQLSQLQVCSRLNVALGL